MLATLQLQLGDPTCVLHSIAEQNQIHRYAYLMVRIQSVTSNTARTGLARASASHHSLHAAVTSIVAGVGEACSYRQRANPTRHPRGLAPPRRGTHAAPAVRNLGFKLPRSHIDGQCRGECPRRQSSSVNYDAARRPGPGDSDGKETVRARAANAGTNETAPPGPPAGCRPGQAARCMESLAIPQSDLFRDHA